MKKLCKSIIIVIVVVMMLSLTFAKSIYMSLDEAVRFALEHSKDIEIANLNI